ncbi:MAG: alpha/beta fold hydrolase [Pseudomonadota bacterium]
MKKSASPHGSARSEIISRLYDVALDPARYEELLDIWEQRVGHLRPGSVDQGEVFSDLEIESHCERANVFLDRAEASSDAREALLAEFRTVAAFIVDPSLRVSRTNAIAESWLGVREGTPVSSLPFDPGAGEHLQHGLARGFAGRGPRTVQMRVRSSASDRVTLLQVRVLQGADPFALVVTSEFKWPATLDKTLSEAFGLTPSEIVVIRGLVEALSIKDIAERRGRSLETVRTQLKAIFQKTETHGQAELIRVCLSLMDIVAVTESAHAASAGASNGGARLETRSFLSITRPDGRRFEYLILGDRNGRPLLFLPMDYGLVRWPATAEAEAARRGLQVVVPVRAGFGASSPLPRDVGTDSYGPTLSDDVHALLDHLGIRRCPIISLGNDSWYAHQIAARQPERISGMLMAAGALPMTASRQYERMGKWHRFITANARYAPTLFPFMVKSGFSLARRIGRRSFLHAVYAVSAADLATIEEPEVLEAMLAGSEVALSKTHSAHDAFAREVFAKTRDWRWAVRACQSIPVHFMVGDQDQHAPPETVNEWEAEWPHIRFERLENSGYLLFFQRWRAVLDRIEAMMPSSSGS